MCLTLAIPDFAHAACAQPVTIGDRPRVYLDAKANGVLSVGWDMGTLPPEVPLGTDFGGDRSLLSEALVAAMLWDLADDSPEERAGVEAITAAHEFPYDFAEIAPCR